MESWGAMTEAPSENCWFKAVMAFWFCTMVFRCISCSSRGDGFLQYLIFGIDEIGVYPGVQQILYDIAEAGHGVLDFSSHSKGVCV